MAEEREYAAPNVSGSEATDPAAVSLALGAAAQNGRVAAKAEAFLEKQAALSEKLSVLVELQAEELRRELRLHHWSLRVQHVSGLMKLAFEIAVAFIVLAIAVLIGNAIWNAAHDRGLVIEAFQVPPDLASRGLTGEVVASQLLDRLTAMQNATNSARPPQSYANNWGNDIKVQIPDTGVSIGEFNRYLQGWLGHETLIGGEVFRSANGVTVTARVSGNDSVSFSGPVASLDALLQRAAEHIYEQTQPYRYASYFMGDIVSAAGAQSNEARQVFTRLTVNPDPEERAWAWLGLSAIALYHDGDARGAIPELRNALSNKPGLVLALFDMAETEDFLGHSEAAFTFDRATERAFDRLSPGELSPRAMVFGQENAANTATAVGDFSGAIAASQHGMELPPSHHSAENFRDNICDALAFEHDGKAARAALRSMPTLPASDMDDRALRLEVVFLTYVALHDWPAVAMKEPAVEKIQRTALPGFDNKSILATQFRPWLALAKAKLGDISAAEAVIGTTPADCYDYVRVRGSIAALAHRSGAAAYWFAIATKQGPSLPFAYTDWGRVLMAQGDIAEAIEKFTLANAKGPHFADPIEMWGEALMQKNRSDLALAKFEEANKFAPHWGRLHLKWAKALFYAGHEGDAQKQFAIASHLDMSASDRAQLRTMENKPQ